MLTARQIMTENVVTMPPTLTVREAIEMLLEKGISGLPIVDSSGVLVGIVSEFGLMAIAYDEEALNHPVSEHMTTDVLTVEAEDPISKVADLCIAHRVRRVPVMENCRVIGMISRRDVLKAVYESRSLSAV